MHFQHHAKPNCFRKDPDINMHPFFFALGKILSVEVSRNVSGKVLENGSQPEQRALGGNDHNAIHVDKTLGPGWLAGSCGRQ